MKICLLQMSPRWEDCDANIAAAEQLMDQQPEAELYVLPEMWCTGFVVEPGSGTAGNSQKGLEWMVGAAQRRHAAIAGSLALPLADGGGVFANTFVLARPDGSCVSYNKRHLFAYGGEQTHFKGGTRRVVTAVQGVRLLPQICYDLRFPVFSRNRGDYDLAVYVANWPERRQVAWDTLLKARAIENQCYVVGVNRVGEDQNCRYVGGSVLIDPYGRIVAQAGAGECAVAGELSLERLCAFRHKFAVLGDADDCRLPGVTDSDGLEREC